LIRPCAYLHDFSMTPQKILILQETLSKSTLLQVESLVPNATFFVRNLSESVLDEIQNEKISMVLVEWTGSSSEMRDFIKELEKVRPFVSIVALLTASSSSAALDPTLLRMDGMLSAPYNESVLRFMIENLAKNAQVRWTRKAPRAEVLIPIELFNATRTIQFSAMVKNVSTGGMFVELSSMAAPLDRDQEVHFFDESSQDGGFRGSGLIRWIQNSDDFTGIGIQFMHLDPSAKAHIEQVLPAPLEV
jgi:hypothetical protein